MLSEYTVIGERPVAAIADHDVIEDSDAEEIAGLFEAARERAVLRGRLRISGRVVVDEDDGRGVADDRWLEDLARVNERGRECPSC